jgi:membrane protein insertase Oxa1/YidC/SpoIIIJ
LKFERGELKANAGTISKEMEAQMQDFLKNLQDKNIKPKSGCLSIALVFVVFSSSLIYGISKLIL